MEALRIRYISEADIDAIVSTAGGRRLTAPGSADYQLNEALVELKLVEEEGFHKEERQVKLARLFQQNQPGRSTVVISPKLLGPSGQREYYNIVRGPIHRQVCKAAKQLEKTACSIQPSATRVLLILNVGYTGLSPDDFKAVCVKCAQNDTRKIDWLICGGIYYKSDGFDYTLTGTFEDVVVNVSRAFPSYQRLLVAWNGFLEQFATDAIRNSGSVSEGTLPMIDLEFERDGIRFVKPSPRLPPSSFWPGGRCPRQNSREEETPGPCARTFPALGYDDWTRLKAALPHEMFLQGSYADWLAFQQEQESKLQEDRCPFVPVAVAFDQFAATMRKPQSEWEFGDLCKFATERFILRVNDLLESTKDVNSIAILPVEYLGVTVREIGGDKANDLCTIEHICELRGFEREEVIMEDIRAYWEEGMVLAAAYAVKRNVEMLLYRRTRSAG